VGPLLTGRWVTAPGFVLLMWMIGARVGCPSDEESGQAGVTAGSDGSLPAVTGRYLTRKASRSTVCDWRPRPVVMASM
jgi:hypothetical protein